MSKKSNNEQLVRKNRRGKKGEEKGRLLQLSLSYKGQPHAELWLEGAPAPITTTVTTGVVAQVYAVASASVTSFATRFGSTFVEYRIVAARFRTRCYSTANPGLCVQWFDEKSNATPTTLEAVEKMIQSFPFSDQVNSHSQKWNPTDMLDLQYIPIATSTPVCYFKTYSDAAFFGSPVIATNVGIVMVDLLFQFRELRGI